MPTASHMANWAAMTKSRIDVFAIVVFAIVQLLLVAPAANAQPGNAVPIAPVSDVSGNHITFTWQSGTGATWYQFWLGRPDASAVLDHWYTAEAAGCAAGGACTITVAPVVKAGPYNWYVRTWSSAGYGAWSGTFTFTVKEITQTWSGALPASRRFTLVLNGEGVLDNETGLVWQRSLPASTFTWPSIFATCYNATIGGKRGWRVPTIVEFMSLAEPGVFNPALPAGHPFSFTAPPPTFWSATDAPGFPNQYYVYNAGGGVAERIASDQSHKTWCVRGTPVDAK
jgi:hypothetical protein